MLFGRKPYNKKIHQFGVKCFYLDKTYKNALESKGKQAIFVGVTNNDLYKVYDEEKGATLIVIEVKFPKSIDYQQTAPTKQSTTPLTREEQQFIDQYSPKQKEKIGGEKE